MLREARVSSGLRQRDVADRAGVSQSWVSKMECGSGASASVATWAAVASAVEAQLAVFLEDAPGADRPRDFEHLKRQRLIIDVAAAGGWKARPEAALDRTRAFARSIDVLLERDSHQEDAIVEVWDFFADVGGALRGFDAKIAEVERERGVAGPDRDRPWHVSGLFVVRATRRNRRLVAEFASIFEARFPGVGQAWLAALTDATAPMPLQPAMLWTDVRGTRLFAGRRSRRPPA